MFRATTILMVSVAALAATVSFAPAQELKLEEVGSLAAVRPAEIKPNMIAFNDHRRDEVVNSETGLIQFEDWERVQPIQKQYLSLYPNYSEPKINITIDGIAKSYKDKLSMYVLEARFVLAKAPTAVDLSKYATVSFLNKIDSAIKHREITSSDVIPENNPEYAFNKNPERAWCATAVQSACIQSRYQLEGKLPSGIQLANMLLDGKKHADYLEFQSELRVVPLQEINQDNLKTLTGLDAPIVGALEQNIFYVNQVMEFGKFFAVLQQNPADNTKTIVTAYMALAIKNKVLDRKKQFERVPVLRNLVPAQVLMGNSSFNTGKSLSAGLPSYSRNQIVAVANTLVHD
jgi:hypothetical protein